MSNLRVIAGIDDASAPHSIQAHLLSDDLDGADRSLVTSAVLHGLDTDGSGNYNDVQVTPYGALSVRLIEDQIGLDASGRVRIGQLTTLADLKTLNADDTLLLENTGTGTGVFSINKYSMSVTSGQYLIRRSYRYYPYFSGKSQQVEFTFDSFQPEANVTKRAGYFSSNAVAPYDTDKDGVWLESAGGIVTLKIARAGTETLSVAQSAWNYDALAGHDWSAFNVCLIDYLWLGGAVLRLFVKTADGFTLCHVFNYASSAADTFMQSPNHSVRFEIRSTTGSGSMRAICSQVSTEGSTLEAGKQFSINTGSTPIVLALVGTTYPVIGIRKRSGFRDNVVKVTDMAGFVSSNTDALLITLQLNPTLSAPLTYSAVTNTAFESASGNGVITVTTPGTLISSAYLSQNNILPTGILEDDFLSMLGISIGNVSDEIIACATPITATVGTLMSLDLKQY